MTQYDSVYTKTVTCSTSNQVDNFPISANTVSIIADGDCFINFDFPVTATERFLIKSGEKSCFQNIMVSQLNFLAASGTPNIYILAYKKA